MTLVSPRSPSTVPPATSRPRRSAGPRLPVRGPPRALLRGGKGFREPGRPEPGLPGFLFLVPQRDDGPLTGLGPLNRKHRLPYVPSSVEEDSSRTHSPRDTVSGPETPLRHPPVRTKTPGGDRLVKVPNLQDEPPYPTPVCQDTLPRVKPPTANASYRDENLIPCLIGEGEIFSSPCRV